MVLLECTDVGVNFGPSKLRRVLLRWSDVEKARASRNVRRGKGKMRNRRYTTRKGPLVVYSGDSGISRAFRNIPGVDLQDVESLNLLQVRVLPLSSWRSLEVACMPHSDVHYSREGNDACMRSCEN